MGVHGASRSRKVAKSSNGNGSNKGLVIAVSVLAGLAALHQAILLPTVRSDIRDLMDQEHDRMRAILERDHERLEARIRTLEGLHR